MSASIRNTIPTLPARPSPLSPTRCVYALLSASKRVDIGNDRGVYIQDVVVMHDPRYIASTYSVTARSNGDDHSSNEWVFHGRTLALAFHCCCRCCCCSAAPPVYRQCDMQ